MKHAEQSHWQVRRLRFPIGNKVQPSTQARLIPLPFELIIALSPEGLIERSYRYLRGHSS